MNISQNDIRQAWYSRRWAQIVLHGVVWITLFSLPYLLKPSPDAAHARPDPDEQRWHVHFIINAIFLTAFFYLNAEILIPRLVYKKKYWWYGVSLFLLFTVQVFFRWIFIENYITTRKFEIKPTIFFTFFTTLFFLSCSTAWRMIRDKMETDRLASEKENENLKTELSLLRSQVSPHFMFNVLNNMVALARKQSDQLEPSLIKLSSLMRYMLYEADEDTVPLDKETDYLQSYIDLQQQRFGAKVQVNVRMELPESGYEIEPMLLIPFVENAFKHGTGLIQDARINIELRAIQGVLHFSVVNKYNTEYAEIKDKTSGIGLTNVKRRLNLLYRDDYQLLINKQDGWFMVSLLLHLH
ncbi:sensor histidine kinase [Chitinophaga tropicalis]|uniref:GHKL domain-containing protein n=1 Tax=Chitinophaga tropicalis TaxID=2683588 RepID=A0A7K1U3T7_9BACT|nr:histidine kinase [Chitinophaga tropicalis]MVT09027.1 GHKL domain-containing protein [Chitinophaga tropicalis]